MRNSRSTKVGFSIMELMVVIGIMTVLFVIAVPVTSSMMSASNIRAAGEAIKDQFRLARQLAMTENRPIQVRFLDVQTAGSRRLQIFRVRDGDPSPSPTPQPYDKAIILPNSVGFDLDNSPLITNVEPTYVEFTGNGFARFSNGKTDPQFVTIRSANSKTDKNFASIIVDPATGRVTIIRP